MLESALLIAGVIIGYPWTHCSHSKPISVSSACYEGLFTNLPGYPVDKNGNEKLKCENSSNVVDRTKNVLIIFVGIKKMY